MFCQVLAGGPRLNGLDEIFLRSEELVRWSFAGWIILLNYLGKDGEGRNELLQYCMDLAMLQRGQLQGESLERFVKKAQGFILD